MPSITAGTNISSSAQLNNDVVTAPAIATDAVDTAEIKSGAVATDEIFDGTIVNNDISASAGIVDTKLAQITTASKVSGSALTLLANIPADAGVIPSANLPGGLDSFIIPKPVLPATGVTATGVSNDVDASVGSFILEKAMTVNKLSFYCSAVTTAGTVKIGIFSEDGQTRHISITTASVAGAGVVTTAVGAVSLTAGTYYVVLVRGALTNITVSTYTDMATALNLANVASEPLVRGLLTVTANTMPATFTVTSSGSYQDIANKGLIIRLDN